MPDLTAIAKKAARLDAEIKLRSLELQKLKAQLVAGGAGDYGVCKVILPAPSLKPDPAAIAEVQKLAGPSFKKLFATVLVHKPVKGFREIVDALFPAALARKITDLCEVESAPQVRFS